MRPSRAKLKPPTQSDAANLRTREICSKISEKVRWIHFILVNGFAILGHFVPLVSPNYGRYPSIAFLCQTINYPVYSVVKVFNIKGGDTFLSNFLTFQLTVIPSTLIYGILSYLITWPIVRWLTEIDSGNYR